jgi:gas vesicle protein
MRIRESDSNVDIVLIALAAGIGLGFGLGILLAPQSGARTRSAIRKSAYRGIDQVKDTVDDLRSSASDLVEKGRRAVDDHKDTITQAFEGVRKTYRDVVG